MLISIKCYIGWKTQLFAEIYDDFQDFKPNVVWKISIENQTAYAFSTPKVFPHNSQSLINFFKVYKFWLPELEILSYQTAVLF